MDKSKFILVVSTLLAIVLAVFLGFFAAKFSVSLGIHEVNTELFNNR